MRRLFLVFVMTLVLPAVVEAKHKTTHVRITKPYVVQPVSIPVVLIPPMGMLYDLSRRTNCQGDILGLGGPGFDAPITPATGNVMTTAYMRGECPAPK